MKTVEPTKKQVFDAMKDDGCTWCGGYGCECHYKFNMQTCFEQTKKRLTRTEYTDAEIEEMKQKANEEPCDAEEAFEYFFNYCNS